MMRPIEVQDAPNCRIRQTGFSPEQLSLGQNIPNPFGEYTQIGFKVPVSGPVTLQVFDMTGKLVDTLVDADMAAGDYDVEVNSSELQPGLYLYVLSFNGVSTSRTMVRH
jgi:hypothetical protein